MKVQFKANAYKPKGHVKVFFLSMVISTKKVDNVFMISTPEKRQDKNWILVPTLQLHTLEEAVPGPNFDISLRWLRWTLQIFSWYRTPAKFYNADDYMPDEYQTCHHIKVDDEVSECKNMNCNELAISGCTWLDSETWPESPEETADTHQ